MQCIRHIVTLALLLTALGYPARAKAIGSLETRLRTRLRTACAIERGYRYKRWTDALRVTNGIIEAILLPNWGGRIIHLGLEGKGSVLYRNPYHQEHGPEPTKDVDRLQNAGGLFTTIAPQADYEQLFSRIRPLGTWSWPPPLSHITRKATIQASSGGVSVVTGVDVEGEPAIVNAISLNEATLTVESRLVGRQPQDSWTPWQIASVVPGSVFLLPKALESMQALAGGQPSAPVLTQQNGGPIRLRRNPIPGRAHKLGFGASKLVFAPEPGDALLRIRHESIARGPSPAGEPPLSVYLDGGEAPYQYIELETVGALRNRSSLRVHYDLRPLNPREALESQALQLLGEK